MMILRSFLVHVVSYFSQDCFLTKLTRNEQFLDHNIGSDIRKFFNLLNQAKPVLF